MAWIGAVVQGVTGIAQTIAASSAAKNLPDAQKYEATPQMKRAEAMAERRAEQGMSSAERAAFEQGMARRTGAAERAMRNIGMSGIAQGVSNIFNIDAMNQFSAQSEAERRKGEAMYAGIAGQMQGIQDRETTSFNQMLNQQRTALGQAAASGMKNLTGAFGTAAQAANTNKLAEAYANSGDTYNFGVGTTGATTPATTTAPPAPVGGSNVPDLAAVSYTPQQASAMQGVGGVATDPGAYGGMPGIMQPNVMNPVAPFHNTIAKSFASDAEPKFSSTVNPFGTKAETRAFQDYANAQAGYNITGGYGWGPSSSAAYGIYGQQFRNQ